MIINGDKVYTEKIMTLRRLFYEYKVAYMHQLKRCYVTNEGSLWVDPDDADAVNNTLNKYLKALEDFDKYKRGIKEKAEDGRNVEV